MNEDKLELRSRTFLYGRMWPSWHNNPQYLCWQRFTNSIKRVRCLQPIPLPPNVLVPRSHDFDRCNQTKSETVVRSMPILHHRSQVFNPQITFGVSEVRYGLQATIHLAIVLSVMLFWIKNTFDSKRTRLTGHSRANSQEGTTNPVKLDHCNFVCE